ncbi:MAG: radical SAM protein [Patescibacteria group bacterium]|jgi:radical SAM protein with 4Fe4S-binding SPASM domain
MVGKNINLVFRQEYFGGLLYDLKNWQLRYLDKNQANDFLDNPPGDMIIHKTPIQDYLSAPLKVFFGIYSGCNLHCRHCMIGNIKKPQKELNRETIEKGLRDLSAMGVLEVRFSGGEVAQRPDFFEIAEVAKNSNLSVSINSNGCWSEAIESKYAKSGIDRVHFSLDGMEKNHDYIRGRGVFNQCLKTIEYLRSYDKYVRIVVCLRRDNLIDIDNLISLAEKYKCDIKFSPVANKGSAESLSGLLSVQESIKIKEYFDTVKSKVRVFFNYGTIIPEFSEYCDLADFDSSVCGSGRTQLRIETDGVVYLGGCGNVSQEQSIIGKVDDPLLELWKISQEKIIESRRLKGDKCLACSLEKIFKKWLSQPSPSFNYKN